jgi:hypothetical protein
VCLNQDMRRVELVIPIIGIRFALYMLDCVL